MAGDALAQARQRENAGGVTGLEHRKALARLIWKKGAFFERDFLGGRWYRSPPENLEKVFQGNPKSSDGKN
ncbi:hypothetical protein D4S03_05135 [bacterium]|nr:MAG: hypothetical protein D4S03_05135 [bacterium]